MYLYSASGSLFTEDVLLNRIAEKLRISFSDQMNRNVSPGEFNAWRSSLQSFAHVLSHFHWQMLALCWKCSCRSPPNAWTAS